MTSQRTVTMRKESQKQSTVQRRSRKGPQPRRSQVTERLFVTLIATKKMEWTTSPPLQETDTQQPSLMGRGLEYTARTTLPAVQPQSTRTLLCLWKDVARAEGLFWTWCCSHLASPKWEAYVRKVVHTVYSPPHVLA